MRKERLSIHEKLENDNRVSSISDERLAGDGYWVYLKDGWCIEQKGQHIIHENTPSQCFNLLKHVEVCICKECILAIGSMKINWEKTTITGPGCTPNVSLLPLGEGPRRKIIIEIEVTADFEKRLDNQWMVEREIHADRWAWRWPSESDPSTKL